MEANDLSSHFEILELGNFEISLDRHFTAGLWASDH
jgi:hypothetical protein